MLLYYYGQENGYSRNDRYATLKVPIKDVYLSAATIAGTNRAWFEALKSVVEKIKDKITTCPVVQFDKTGLYVEEELIFCY